MRVSQIAGFSTDADEESAYTPFGLQSSKSSSKELQNQMAMTFKCKNSKVSTFTLWEDTNQDFVIDFFFKPATHSFILGIPLLYHKLTILSESNMKLIPLQQQVINEPWGEKILPLDKVLPVFVQAQLNVCYSSFPLDYLCA